MEKDLRATGSRQWTAQLARLGVRSFAGEFEEETHLDSETTNQKMGFSPHKTLKLRAIEIHGQLFSGLDWFGDGFPLPLDKTGRNSKPILGCKQHPLQKVNNFFGV